MPVLRVLCVRCYDLRRCHDVRRCHVYLQVEIKAPPTAGSRGVTKKPACNAKGNDSALQDVTEILKSRKSVNKFPHVIEMLRNMPELEGRPQPAKTPVEYGLSKIFYDPKNARLRIYPMPHDRREQNFNIDFHSPKNKKAQWSLACAYVEAMSDLK